MNRRSYKKSIRAGLTAEEIRIVDRALGKPKKDMKREKSEMAKANEAGYIFISIWDLIEMEDGENCKFDTTDPDFDLERDTIHQEALEELRLYLSELSDRDQDILLTSFSGIKNHTQILMEKYGMSRSQVIRRQRRLLTYMRAQFCLLDDKKEESCERD